MLSISATVVACCKTRWILIAQRNANAVEWLAGLNLHRDYVGQSESTARMENLCQATSPGAPQKVGRKK